MSEKSKPLDSKEITMLETIINIISVFITFRWLCAIVLFVYTIGFKPSWYENFCSRAKMVQWTIMSILILVSDAIFIIASFKPLTQLIAIAIIELVAKIYFKREKKLTEK